MTQPYLPNCCSCTPGLPPRLRTSLKVAFGLLSLLMAILPARGSLFVYTPGSAPASWNNVTNWSQDGNPPPSARVAGTDPADRVIVSGASISGSGAWSMTDLTLNGTITGGTFTIGNSLVMNSGGSTFSSCSVTILGSATLSFSNPGGLAFFFDSVLLENNGKIHLDTGIMVALSTALAPGNGTILENFGTIEMNDTTSILSPITSAGAQLNNDGLILKLATGTGVATLMPNIFFNTSIGYVQSAQGTLLVVPTTTGTNYGHFVAAAQGTNSVVQIASVLLETGTVGQGPGRIVVANGSGGANVLAGDAVIENLFMTGGQIMGPGTLTLRGTCTVSGGTISGLQSNGAFVDTSPLCIISTGAVVTVTGGLAGCDLARSFVNHGELVLVGGQVNTSAGTTLLTSAHFTNATDGLMLLNASGGLGGGAPVLCNQGVLQVSNSAILNGTVINQGDFQLLAGNLNVGSWTQTSGRTYLATGTVLQSAAPMSFPGGSIQGFGSVNASGGVNVSGTISPGASPGTLTFDGSGGALIMQAPSAALDIEIGGRVAGVDFDNVIVGGPATLAGGLNVSFLNAFMPALADSFEILRCTSRTNQFGSITGVRPGNGLVLVPRYSNTNVVLIAANDPVPRSATRSSGQFQFSFLSTLGFNYIVESTSSLIEPVAWQQVGSELTGTGGLLTVSDSSLAVGHAFYRVRFK